MTIRFARGMRFYGQSTDMRNSPAARAEFYKDVHTRDRRVDARLRRRDANLLRPHDQARQPERRDPNAACGRRRQGKGRGAEARDRDDRVRQRRLGDQQQVRPGVEALLQRQRIDGDYLIYEKSTGRFRVPGEGQVYLYEARVSPRVREAG